MREKVENSIIQRDLFDATELKNSFKQMTNEVEAQLRDADKKNLGNLTAAESFIANI